MPAAASRSGNTGLEQPANLIAEPCNIRLGPVAAVKMNDLCHSKAVRKQLRVLGIRNGRQSGDMLFSIAQASVSGMTPCQGML